MVALQKLEELILDFLFLVQTELGHYNTRLANYL